MTKQQVIYFISGNEEVPTKPGKPAKAAKMSIHRCEFCNGTFASQYSLKRHWKRKHSGASVQSKANNKNSPQDSNQNV